MRLYRLRRRPFGFWLLTFLLAGLTAALVLRAGAEADRWGRLAQVVVVSRPVPPGAVVAAGDVRLEWWPARLVPPDAAAASAGDVAGRTALAALWPGEAVLRTRLAPDGLSGAAALVGVGKRAVALPVDGPGLPLRVGDVVDVLATFDAEPTVVVAESVHVVAVTEDAVVVAVDADLAPRLAYALNRSTLTLTQSAISTRAGLVENEGVGR